MAGRNLTPRDIQVREAAERHAHLHKQLIRSPHHGRVLSATQLPLFMVRPPRGFGVITTTGRRSGKPRRKCVRMARRGDRVYIVQLRPPEVAIKRPWSVSAWLLNIRANPEVEIRMRGGTFAGTARELEEPAELEVAREAICDPVHAFDFGECLTHMRGLPTREKIRDLHRYWFDTGIPVVVELRG